MDQRQSIDKSDAEYKNLTKKIKTRVNSLRNDKLQQEAEEINNEHVNRREIEELYRNISNIKRPTPSLPPIHVIT